MFYPTLKNLIIYLYIIFLVYLILQSGDVEENPGDRLNIKNLKLCHWNLNSIQADDFIKITYLQSYMDTHKPDIIVLSETFLNSDIQNDDSSLQIEGYSLIRRDHPDDIPRGGIVYITKVTYLSSKGPLILNLTNA